MGRQVAGPAERFDPKGCKSPDGEWRPGRLQARPVAEAATGLVRRSRRRREQSGRRGWSGRPNGQRKRQARKRSDRPGTLTLEWELRKRVPLQARERSSRATNPDRVETAACQEALIRKLEKLSYRGAERRSARYYRLRCSERCMPAVNNAVNRSLGTIFFLGAGSGLPSSNPD